MLKTLFKDLGLPEKAQDIYKELLEKGSASARTIAQNLSLPRPSVYDYLDLLKNKGLIVEYDKDNKKYFQTDDINKIPNIFDLKIEELTKEKNNFEKLLPSLLQGMSVEPKIKFYSGVEGVRQVLNDMLWNKNIETFALWPISEMVELLGKEYMANMNRKRIRQKLWTRGIWPEDKKVDFKNHPFLGTGKEFFRELRIAPKGMTWNMSYWAYGDKVAFISSRKETFGFVIHSKDFFEMIKAQFEIIWKASKQIKAGKEDTDPFLRTI